MLLRRELIKSLFFLTVSERMDKKTVKENHIYVLKA